jgi:hypothetical protein
MRALVDGLGVEPGSEAILRLRDAHLERWSSVAQLDELRRIFESAYVLGTICRALSWDTILAPLPPTEGLQFQGHVAAWLEIYAESEERPDRLGAPDGLLCSSECRGRLGA